MGYYHVDRKRKGMVFLKSDLVSMKDVIPDEWIPSTEWVNENYPRSEDGEYALMSKKAKLIYLGCLVEGGFWSAGCSSLNEVTAEKAEEIYDTEYYRNRVLLRTLSVIFCYKNGYPARSFVSISDYDGTWMFFCDLDFPPEKYHERLSIMTEEIFKNELYEFINLLSMRPLKPEIDLCEEYIKE